MSDIRSMILRATTHRVLTGVFLALIVAARVSAGEAGRATAPSASPETLDDIEKTLGPFSLGGRNYTVALHLKQLPDAKRNDPDSQALTGLDIRDPSGTIAHRETFAYGVDDGRFASLCSASAELLKGSMVNAILLGAGCLPSAPQSGDTWEVFGVWNDTFMRLGKPFTTQGEMLRFIAGAVTKHGKAKIFQPDVIELRVWTGNFHVTIPLTLSWTQGQITPPRCYEQTGHGMGEGNCELGVAVERVPIPDELTFVRLFAEASEGFGVPKHVVVKRDSKVEFLGARARVVLSGAEIVEVGVADDPWLHVRIDGQEGWLHTQEDFSALGVPQAG